MLHTYSQDKKEKKVLVFKPNDMSFNQNIFKINGVTFKCIETKKFIKFDSIKKFVSNLEEMNSEIIKNKHYNSKKNISFYYSTFYTIYIYVNKNNQSGFLYPVERIWIINGKIID